MPNCCGSQSGCSCVLISGAGLSVTGVGTQAAPYVIALVSSVPRVTTLGYATSITPNIDTTDVLNVGTLTGNITFNNPSGTPRDGSYLRLRLAQDATGSRTLSWGSAYAFGTDVTAALIPAAASAKWEMMFTYHAGDAKWRATGIVRGF